MERINKWNKTSKSPWLFQHWINLRTCHQKFENRTFDFGWFVFFFCEFHLVRSPNSIKLFLSIEFENRTFDFVRFDIFLWVRFRSMAELHRTKEFDVISRAQNTKMPHQFAKENSCKKCHARNVAHSKQLQERKALWSTPATEWRSILIIVSLYIFRRGSRRNGDRFPKQQTPKAQGSRGDRCTLSREFFFSSHS